MQATRSRLALALVSIPVVVAVVLAGIWVTGGVITNSFTVSMWLTAAWMGLAGLVCLAIAVRSRLLRWPVVGAYVVTAAVAGVYLGSSTFFDKTVNEQVATAAPAGEGRPRAHADGLRGRQRARVVPSVLRAVRARTDAGLNQRPRIVHAP